MKEFIRDKNEKIDTLYVILISFLSAFGILIFCTKCSMLYPFQDGMDTNCFFTVGKALTQGKVLYRDIYEHKGLILYLIYSVAYLISETSFIGIFWLEVFCATIFLWYAHKTLRLLTGESQYWSIPILTFIAYTGYSFSYGGQIEELVLPILAWALYTFIRYMFDFQKGEKMLSLVKVFFMGLFTAILFWMKYTLTGFFLGLVLFMVVLQIRERNMKYLLRCALSFICGFLLVTIPVLIYFSWHHALSDLWQVYFYNMLFRYNNRDIGMSRIEYSIRKILLTFWRNKRYSILIVIGVAWFTMQKKLKNCTSFKVGLWMICIVTTFGIFYSTQYNRYWGEVLVVFSTLGFVPVSMLIKKVFSKKRYGIQHFSSIVILLVCIMMSRLFSMNSYLLDYSKEDMPQFIFADIIHSDGQNGQAIMNYGCLDLGMYTVLNVVPECKYFCDYNINLPIIYETQREYIGSGQADYIVTRSPLDFAQDLYEQVSYVEFELEFENYIQPYYLYRKVNL